MIRCYKIKQYHHVNSMSLSLPHIHSFQNCQVTRNSVSLLVLKCQQQILKICLTFHWLPFYELQILNLFQSIYQTYLSCNKCLIRTNDVFPAMNAIFCQLVKNAQKHGYRRCPIRSYLYQCEKGTVWFSEIMSSSQMYHYIFIFYTKSITNRKSC